MKFIRVLLLLFLFVPTFSAVSLDAAQNRTIHAIQLSGRKWINMYDLAKYYNLRFYVSGDNIYFYSKYTRVVFNIKKRTGSFNGTNLFWFFKPLLQVRSFS